MIRYFVATEQQGRLDILGQAHSHEPWKVKTRYSLDRDHKLPHIYLVRDVLLDANGDDIITIDETGSPAASDKDMRRTVACVNLLAGVAIEELEAVCRSEKLRQKIAYQVGCAGYAVITGAIKT